LAAHYDLLALEGECRRPSAPARVGAASGPRPIAALASSSAYRPRAVVCARLCVRLRFEVPFMLSPGGLWCALGLRRAPTRGAPTSSSMSATSALQPPASSLQSPAPSISLLMAGASHI